MRMFRFLLQHCITGVLIGVVFGYMLIWTDVGGLGTLIASSEHGLLGKLLLFFGLAVTFGSASMGTAIMAIGFDDDPRG